MKFLSIVLILIGISSSVLVSTPNRQPLFSSAYPEFVIVILSYNNEKWARENLESACTQKSSHPFQVLCVNDCSTDSTGRIMETYVKEHHLESMVTIIHNRERQGAMANWYTTIHTYIPDHKIVVNLDGDDLLAHDKVLLTLEKYYRDPAIWLTYGSAKAYPSGEHIPYMSQAIPEYVFRQNRIRDYSFIAQHLRTFKAGLFKKIRKEDFMVEGVDLVPDMAFMLPMLEMCTPAKGSLKNHSQFVPEIVYLYRTDNPLNLFRTHPDEQKAAGKRIAALKPYRPLDEELYSNSSILSNFVASKYA